MPNLQQFQVPNFAAGLSNQINAGKVADAATQNAATKAFTARGNLAIDAGNLGVARGNLAVSQDTQKLEQDKFTEEQTASARTEAIRVNEIALNTLAGVNSPEDLEIAKAQFKAQFPDSGAVIDRILPTYSASGVRIIRNGMRSEVMKLKEEEIQFQNTLNTRKQAETERTQKAGDSVAERAQTLDETTQTFEQTKPIGFAPGTLVLGQGGREEQVPFKPDAPEGFELFTDESGNQAYMREGDKIPTGFTRVDKKGSGNITIQTGDLGKGTKTALQKDIIKGVQNISSFQETREAFKPEYLTLFGKGESGVAKLMDKAGLSTEGQKKLITERSKWFTKAKGDFIAYRKWATGVAGGEKELKEIATSFPDPVNNSPTEYLANLDAIEETTKRILQLNADFLSLEIDMTQPLAKIVKEMEAAGMEAPPGMSQAGSTIKFVRDAQGNIVISGGGT